MDADRFLLELPGLFDAFPAAEHPRDRRCADVIDRLGGLARENNLALLNLAVSLLPPGEAYVEVGTYRGTSLVGALLGNEAEAVAIDSFAFRDGSREVLDENLAAFGVAGRVTVLEGDAYDMLGGGALGTRRVGVYYWDAGHDRDEVSRGLRLIEPWLAPGALLIVDDSDWERVSLGVDDHLAADPHARRILTIDGSGRGAPQWWEGMQVLVREP
jgi:predicted O-methyltransferase YrrM